VTVIVACILRLVSGAHSQDGNGMEALGKEGRAREGTKASKEFGLSLFARWLSKRLSLIQWQAD
jgi:hypothetical protein